MCDIPGMCRFFNIQKDLVDDQIIHARVWNELEKDAGWLFTRDIKMQN